MNLVQASNESHWDIAGDILEAVVLDLNTRNKSLWNINQVAKFSLKNQYSLNELFFLVDNKKVLGCVFIQNYDPIFWPEIANNESIFLHKLAVHPDFRGKSYGYKIIELAINHAKQKNISWVRLDCDTRVELKNYYETFGFQSVNQLIIDGFDVARYQLLITSH